MKTTDPYIPIRGNAYHVALIGSEEPNDSPRLAYGTWNGTIACHRPGEEKPQWMREIDGFPFDLGTYDVDGDGQDEVLVATANGSVYVIRAHGTPGEVWWRYRCGMPVYGVDAGRTLEGEVFVAAGGVDRILRVFGADGELRAEEEVEFLVHRVLVTDQDGDGGDGIIYLDGRETLVVTRLIDNRLETIRRTRLTVPEEMRNWENPRGGFFAFDITAGPTDAHGGRSIVLGDAYFNKQRIMLLDSRGETVWISDSLDWWTEPDRWYEFYSTALVAVADAGIVTVAGGEVRLFDTAGGLIGHARSRLGFTDVTAYGDVLYLGSTPNGDETIYRIDLTGDWVKQIEELEPQSLARKVADNIDTLRSRLSQYAGEKPTDRGPYTLLMSFLPPEQYPAHLDGFRRQVPYENLTPAVSAKVIEHDPPKDPEGRSWSPRRWQTDSILGTMSPDEIVDKATYIEKNRIPTYFAVGHSCMPFITLETAERMLQAAPNYLLGFVSAEDENILERGQAYFRHFFGPLADLCVKYGYKECVTKNKNLWWAAAPALQPIFEELFRGERRRVLVVETEDSNSRTPEINLFARAGLRQAGLACNIRASVHMDLFSYCRFHQWEYPRNGSAFLRLLIAHTVLGCNSFRDTGLSTLRQSEDLVFTRFGREYIETFCSLLGKGLLAPPEPSEMVGFSSVGIAMHDPPEKWLADAFNGHRPWLWNDDPELDQAVIPHNGCEWGNSPTPPHALQAVLLNKRRQFGYYIPPTPFGPFLIVPAHADLNAVPGIKEWWHTDGVYIWREANVRGEAGPRLHGQEAAEALRASFSRAAANLPFRTSGDDIFIQTLRTGMDSYRIYLIDPGWIDPADRHVTLHIQLPDTFRLTDMLTGEVLSEGTERTPEGSPTVDLTIPAGVFRILEALQ